MALKLRHVLSTTPFLRSSRPTFTQHNPLQHPLTRLYRTKKQPSSSPPQPTAEPTTLTTSIPQSTIPTITPGSLHHSTLSTFLAHAHTTALSPTSTVYVGTLYEYTVLSALAPLGFTLTRTGRSADNGIDLLGTWSVPSHPLPLRVLVQCKSHARALKPEHVRELEGAFRGAPPGWRGDGVLGFLVGPREATKGVRDALARSELPVGFLMVDGGVNGSAGKGESGGAPREGRVRQFLWNHEATKKGLEGLGVTLRYGESGSGEVTKEVALMWNGWAITKAQEMDGEVEKPNAYEEAVTKKRGRPKKILEKLVAAEEMIKKKPGQRKKNG